MKDQKKPTFNDVYSRGGLPNLRDGAYLISLDDYFDIGTHWTALYVVNDNVTYLDNFGVEHVPKEIKAFIRNKNIKTNILRIQADDSIMCGYFCIEFIVFMLAGKTLTDFFNLFYQVTFKKMMI